MNKQIMILAAGVLLSSTALAATDERVSYSATPSSSGGDSRFYVGAGLGQSNTYLTSGLSKNSDTAYSLLAGYSIERNFAIELQYANLGNITATNTSTASSNGGSIAGLGFMPVTGNLSVYGKFGLAKVNTSWNTAVAATPTSQSKTGFVWGVGTQLDYSPQGGVRLSFDRYNVGANSPVTGFSSMVAATLIYRF